MIDDPLMTLLLAPILIPQGIYTRKVTPKLPEAGGERAGVHGKGKPLRLLILGDSAAAGVGVDSQSKALSGNLIAKLSNDFLIDWRLEAESGVKTSEVIQKLESMNAFKTDVVLISLGVNDVTSSIQLKVWLRLQEKLKVLLLSKFSAKHILMCSLPPMHAFPSLPQPLRWYLGRRSTSFNSALLKQSLSSENFEFVPVSFPMKQEYFADDGFHPSHLAYSLWSEVALKHICLKFKGAGPT